MKKIITKFTFALAILCSNYIFGQYSNSSLNGPWMTRTDTDAYILFDGNGNISEFGVFNGVTGSNIGTYSVTSGGAITGNLSVFSATFTGQLLAADTGSLVVAGLGTLPLKKIYSPGALTTTLTGTLVDDSTSTTKNVTFTINTNGQISAATGLTGVIGRVYTENGIFAGYITSTDSSMGSCWQKMMVAGTYTNNALSGTIKFDCTGHGGPIQLVRSGTATITNIATILEENNFQLYPNPFNNRIIINANNSKNLQIKLIDVSGKIVLDKFYNSSITTIEELGSLNSGIYILEIIQNSKTANYRVIKD